MSEPRKIGQAEIRPDHRYMVLERHLQQDKPLGARLNEWGPLWPLKWDVVMPQMWRIHELIPLTTPIAYAGTSRLVRAMQTSALIVPQAQQVMKMESLTPPDFENTSGAWDVCLELKGETAMEFEAVAPKLFESCGEQVLGAIFGIASTFVAPGEIGHVTTHNPLCEAAVAKFFGGVGKLPFPNFGKGDMALFELHEGSISDFWFLPVPAEPVVDTVSIP